MIYLDNAATTRPCAEAVAAVNDALTARWPQRETPWLLHLRMAAALRDGAAIQKTLHDIEEKEVYLSAKGRETVRFWQGKNA